MPLAQIIKPSVVVSVTSEKIVQLELMIAWISREVRFAPSRSLNGYVNDTKKVICNVLSHEQPADLSTTCRVEFSLKTVGYRYCQKYSHSH